MDFKTHISFEQNEKIAIKELLEGIETKNLSSVICYFTQDYSAKKLSKAFRKALPNVSILGCSTSKGIMTERGVHFGRVIGIIAIYDSGLSAYGSGLVTFSGDKVSSKMVRKAVDVALKKAGREGEVPSFAIVHSTPGFEETLIRSIDDVFQTPIPIVGASAADNGIKRQWSIFNEDKSTNNGFAIQLLFPSKSLASGFSAGYSPTSLTGIVTKANERELLEIDSKPAQDVYREWICEQARTTVPEHLKFEFVTQFPLGRIAGTLYGQPYYKLSHPVDVNPDGGIHLFTDIEVGDQVTLMSGDKRELMTRPARVIKEAKRQSNSSVEMSGAVCIICAGAMKYLGDDINEVYQIIKQEMGDTPFICPFTFGEQGRFINGENGHGNLMISSVTFYSS